MTSISVRSNRRNQLIDVTQEVQRVVAQAGLTDGVVVLYVPHTTAAVTIQENADPDVVHDLLWKLERLVPHREAGYEHGEGNSDAHVKCSLIGVSQMVPVQGGRLVLGTWQGIWFCEFDGPRTRQLFVQCLPGRS